MGGAGGCCRLPSLSTGCPFPRCSSVAGGGMATLWWILQLSCHQLLLYEAHTLESSLCAWSSQRSQSEFSPLPPCFCLIVPSLCPSMLLIAAISKLYMLTAFAGFCHLQWH